MAWVAIAAAAIGAAGSAYSANAASDAQSGAAGKNRALQQQQYLNALAMGEPNRALGYGATSDLAALCGYAVPQYTPLGALQGGYAGPYTVGGTQGGVGSVRQGVRAATFGIGGANALFGGGDRKYGGNINPMAGTVDVKGKGAKVDDRLTEYLRTGQSTGSGSGDAYSRLRKRIDEMRANGYAYDPAAATAQQAGPLAAPTGQQSMLDKFRSMPGYAFGMQEGTNALQSSAEPGRAVQRRHGQGLDELGPGLRRHEI